MTNGCGYAKINIMQLRAVEQSDKLYTEVIEGLLIALNCIAANAYDRE